MVLLWERMQRRRRRRWPQPFAGGCVRWVETPLAANLLAELVKNTLKITSSEAFGTPPPFDADEPAPCFLGGRCPFLPLALISIIYFHNSHRQRLYTLWIPVASASCPENNCSKRRGIRFRDTAGLERHAATDRSPRDPDHLVTHDGRSVSGPAEEESKPASGTMRNHRHKHFRARAKLSLLLSVVFPATNPHQGSLSRSAVILSECGSRAVGPESNESGASDLARSLRRVLLHSPAHASSQVIHHPSTPRLASTTRTPPE